MKKIGLLCPLFTLPNNHGIGDFGECAYEFIDYLASIKYSYWQILPLNPTDKYGCPYTSISSFALDDIYVSLTNLKTRGLIKKIKPYGFSNNRVNYEEVRKYKNKYLNEAYLSFKKNKNANAILNKFKQKHPRVNEYAQYVVLRRLNDSPLWNKWKITTLKTATQLDLINREIFKQYILFEQWDLVHKYAKMHHIEIIGDIPFYVGFDSADVYFNRQSFLLNQENKPTLVAGVPPDYYSKNGQLWGNPIYNWKYLLKNEFKLIIERILFAEEIYDKTRLDHFRAYDTYYTINSKMKTARKGKWQLAPGYKFFDYLFKHYPYVKLIAEDLGDMREEVFALRDYYHLPGMQVIQFTMVDEEIKHHKFKHVYKRKNSIIYISTHDSYTGIHWLKTINKKERKAIYKFLEAKFGKNEIMLNLFKYVCSEPADTVILSITDVLRLGKEGRINVPGIKSKFNWNYRLTNLTELRNKRKELINLAKESKRN